LKRLWLYFIDSLLRWRKRSRKKELAWSLMVFKGQLGSRERIGDREHMGRQRRVGRHRRSKSMAVGSGEQRAQCGRGRQRGRELGHFCIGIRDVGRSLRVGWSWSLRPVRSSPTIMFIYVSIILSKGCGGISNYFIARHTICYILIQVYNS